MRVIIIDGRHSTRTILHLVLQHINMIVLDADPREILDKAKTFHPELMVFDWELDGAAPNRVLGMLLQALDDRPLILVLSTDPGAYAAAMAAGADAFIGKNDLPEQVWEKLLNISCMGTSASRSLKNATSSV